MSKNAKLKVALTRTIVNFFLNEDLCTDEINIQATLCVTADKSTIFVTQIAETIVDPNSAHSGQQDDSFSAAPGDLSRGDGSHRARQDSSGSRLPYDARLLSQSSTSSSGAGSKRSSAGDGDISIVHQTSRNFHPLQQLRQVIDPHRSYLGKLHFLLLNDIFTKTCELWAIPWVKW